VSGLNAFWGQRDGGRRPEVEPDRRTSIGNISDVVRRTGISYRTALVNRSRPRSNESMFLRAITAHTIWQIPMKTSQTPATTASTAIESKGQAITTMPAIMQTMRKNPCQPRPGSEDVDLRVSAASS
jgi:hypothetical protein